MMENKGMRNCYRCRPGNRRQRCFSVCFVAVCSADPGSDITTPAVEYVRAETASREAQKQPSLSGISGALRFQEEGFW